MCNLTQLNLDLHLPKAPDLADLRSECRGRPSCAQVVDSRCRCRRAFPRPRLVFTMADVQVKRKVRMPHSCSS